MADSSVPITAGTGTNIRALSNLGSAFGFQQVVTLADQFGNLVPSDPDGTPQVSTEATGLFLDDFSGTLATNWTTGGTAPTNTNGVLATSNVTTLSATSYMRSIGNFTLRAGSYLTSSFHVKFETGTVTNNTRWWGYALNQTTPTAAAPVLNGAVFQLDYAAGALQAATYSAGTKVTVATLTRPTDGAYHRYEIVYRQSSIYWVIDGVAVATQAFANLAVMNNLALVVGSANFTTAASAAPLLNVSSSSIRDMSGTNHSISDGVNPYIQATVKPASTASAATDLPLVVAAHPNSATPAGTNVIGAVSIGSTTVASSFYTSTTTNAATVAKASAGNIQALLISNTSASTQYVKLFNATAATLGTTAAVVDIPIATLSTLTLNLGANGLRMTTGITYAVTGASGATNNTAGAGGVYIALTYV